MNIQELIANGQNVTISVTPADLKEFALTVAEEVKALLAKEDKPDKRLTAKDAAGNETAQGAFTYAGGAMTVVLSEDGFALKDAAQ